MINTTGKLGSFCAFLSPLAPLRSDSLATILSLHASRSMPHPPAPAGSGRARTFSRWRLPATDHLIDKDRTGPDLDERPLYLSMSPKQAIPAENLIRFSPLAAAQQFNILSRPETLNASGSRRACRMAISRNARSLPDFPEFAQAVRYGVPGTPSRYRVPGTPSHPTGLA